jgi:adenosylcobinamide-phosphate synthase
MIGSRDTKHLTEPDIVKGAVETVAENLTDGVIAPLIFIAIGGAPLGMAYKAVNTLDSMIGYKTEEFFYFGKFAARFDDVVNFVPARISALMLIIGSLFVKASPSQAARIYWRDKRNHASPNSAQSMSACAGALGLKLGGDTVYHGQLVHKPTIGDAVYELLPEQIVQANRLMYAATISAATMLVIGCMAFMILGGLINV